MTEKIIVLSVSTIKTVIGVLQDTAKLNHKWVRAADSLLADGADTASLMTEKDGGNKALREQIKAEIIVMSYPEASRKLLAADPKTLEATDKMERKELQQGIGRDLATIQKHVREAEFGKPERDAGSAKTPVQQIQNLLDDVLGKLQKLENPAFDIAESVKRVKAIKGMIPAL